MTDSTLAQLIAALILGAITAALFLIRRRKYVAVGTVTYVRDGVTYTVANGHAINRADLGFVEAAADNQYAQRSLAWFRSLIVGADNRTSTSKTVALAWTYVIAFGLLTLIIARWLGSPGGFDELVDAGLQEEYWLFLGGPYAAAIIARWSTTRQESESGKTEAPVDAPSAGQLIENDLGDADLGDFQYVLFNVVALAYFLGEFIQNVDMGFPDLPAVLTGLALTSAGTYSAKKLFLQQARPTLTSVVPAEVAHTAAVPATFDVWGRNLIVPADAAPDGSALPPTVLVGGKKADVVSSEQTLGADRIGVRMPAAFVPPTPTTPTKVTAVRADGIQATGPGGMDGVTVTLTT
jgi:hypothetical protein